MVIIFIFLHCTSGWDNEGICRQNRQTDRQTNRCTIFALLPTNCTLTLKTCSAFDFKNQKIPLPACKSTSGAIFLVKFQSVVLDSAIWRIFSLELKFSLHADFCWIQIWTRPEQEWTCLTGSQRSKTVKIKPGVKWVSILAFDLSKLARDDDARVEGT